MRLDLALRVRDLVLDRVILLVGLHRHRLLAKLRQAALVQRELLLDVAARALVLGEPRLRIGDVLLRRIEPGVERPLAFGFVGEFFLRRVHGAVEPLQGDHTFEVSVHRGSKAKKRPRRRGAWILTWSELVRLRAARFGGRA